MKQFIYYYIYYILLLFIQCFFVAFFFSYFSFFQMSILNCEHSFVFKQHKLTLLQKMNRNANSKFYTNLKLHRKYQEQRHIAFFNRRYFSQSFYHTPRQAAECCSNCDESPSL